MRRRDFITLLGGAAAWPLAARAQQAQPMRRIGVLTVFKETDSEASTWLRAFRDELQKLGWEQARTIEFEYRLAGSDPQQLTTSAAELIALQPDAIFAVTPLALLALQPQTTEIPIVFVQVSDPVQLGFVTSLPRPSGNITGFVTFEHQIVGKWVGLLKDIAPGKNHIAVLVDPQNPSQTAYLQELEAVAQTLGVQVKRAAVRNAADIEQVITAFAQQPSGGLIVPPSVVAMRHRGLIIDLAAQWRLPAVYPYRHFAREGGLVSYGADLHDLYRKAATYVDRILRGTQPGDLPVQLSSKFELVVNLKTAKALGLTIPEPFLLQADEVIE